ncbi:ROK family protein [Bacillus suaedae]|uniref:ROK family protein n=1 Tax=Halalkalibacter suaedae TaxID=2822140 RepID=A0A940WVQ3_9BACI|nr:ROK family protein [Bacillus suaedae]MBP3953146.1 ROK family protein [Bacillus suaedae]
MGDYAVGIDIGGTKVAIGLVDDQGVIQAQKTIKMNQNIPPTEMVREMIDSLRELLLSVGINQSELKGIGIGAPGPLNSSQGIIISPPNLPKWRDFHLVDEMKKYVDLPIRLENDANAAAVAEKWVGAAQKDDSFVYLTISTGIGAGIFLDGKLISGRTGNAGEFGHVVLDASQDPCDCGQRGCWTSLASGTAIAKRASMILGKPVTTEEVIELAKLGDPQMSLFIQDTFEYIGMGCVTIINSLDPGKVIIGGGVSQAGDLLFATVREYVRMYALNPSGRDTEIVEAELGQMSGLVGAAGLVCLD